MVRDAVGHPPAACCAVTILTLTTTSAEHPRVSCKRVLNTSHPLEQRELTDQRWPGTQLGSPGTEIKPESPSSSRPQLRTPPAGRGPGRHGDSQPCGATSWCHHTALGHTGLYCQHSSYVCLLDHRISSAIYECFIATNYRQKKRKKTQSKKLLLGN